MSTQRRVSQMQGQGTQLPTHVLLPCPSSSSSQHPGTLLNIPHCSFLSVPFILHPFSPASLPSPSGILLRKRKHLLQIQHLKNTRCYSLSASFIGVLSQHCVTSSTTEVHHTLSISMLGFNKPAQVLLSPLGHIAASHLS